MKPFQPYVSIDLETTGLAIDKVDILEIGAVYDDGASPINELNFFHRVIKLKTFKYAESYAINMNAKLIEESLKTGVSPADAFLAFDEWLLEMRHLLPSTKSKQLKLPRLTAAGKNVAGFDLPILDNNTNHYTFLSDPIIEHFTHRTLDVGSLYFPDFGENVSLGEINKLTGRAENVSHRALDDAFDVVYAIRHKMKQRQEIEDKMLELIESSRDNLGKFNIVS